MAFEVLYMQTGETPARLDRWWIGRVFTEGISDVPGGDLIVSQRAIAANLSVDVAAGEAIIDGDDVADQGAYLVRSTVLVNVPLAAPPVANSRVDLIVLRVLDSSVTVSDPALDGALIEVVEGVSAPVPVAPAVPLSAVPLAQVVVAAGTAAIVAANITDRRSQVNAQTLQIFAKSWPVHDHGSVAGLVTLDAAEEAVHVLTASAALTLAFTGFVAGEAQTVPVHLKPFVSPVTWPAPMVWIQGAVPDLGPARNVMEFSSRDGGLTIDGILLGQDMYYGGYLAGIIDTTVGNIIAADASQVGARYALVVAPRSLEQASLQFKTTNDLAPAASRTKWNGLAATAAMASASYPAANYCNGLAYPADGGSKWYLPSMDELELVYRKFKPTTEVNSVAARAAGTFPGVASTMGVNASSAPAGAAYTTGSPAQTSVPLFKSGFAQALDILGGYYWSSTEYDATNAWVQYASGGDAGYQSGTSKSYYGRVRPVRRVVL